MKLGIFNMLRIGVEPMTVERSGAQFEGYKFSGKKMLDEMGDSQGSVGLLWASELEEFGISKQEIAEFLKLIETPERKQKPQTVPTKTDRW